MSIDASRMIPRSISRMMPGPCRVITEHDELNDRLLLAIEVPPKANQRQYQQEPGESAVEFACRAAEAYLDEFGLRHEISRYEK